MQNLIRIIKRFVSVLFVAILAMALFKCAKRGTPTGGPKDTTPPVQTKAEPEGFSTNFNSKIFRIYFDEYIKLENPQDQLIISPPLQYVPLLHPQGSASKYLEVEIQDTLQENTTYTFNFGQSIIDNNENNPASFLSYVFSTGDYLDSLTLTGSVKDAFNQVPDQFISIMLYEIDSAYSDSIIYNSPPKYITNTLDSLTTFSLQNLKAGTYRLVAIKDEAKNNVFDQAADKIGFVPDTISLPTDSVFTLRLFQEVRDFDVTQPSLVSANRIIFGFYGENETIDIQTISEIPDSLRSMIAREPGKDTLNYWFTPPMPDSIVFEVRNDARQFIDTFTVKSRSLSPDTMLLDPSHSRQINFQEEFSISSNTPLIKADTSRILIMNQDSVIIPFKAKLDTLQNALAFEFEKEPNNAYTLQLLPETLSDFFGSSNDTLFYTISTRSLADYANLTLNLSGSIDVPLIIQLISERGEMVREVYKDSLGPVQFNALEPATYGVRAILDRNKNGKWDTGSYLKKIQPERVIYRKETLGVRANWEMVETFNLKE